MSSVIDFHSHILPNVDDGSASIEDSIEMLRLEASQGIKKVVATPHFYADHHSPDRFFGKRQEALLRLTEVMNNAEDLPELLIGAEVHFFEGISDAEILSDMAISGTNCVLIEMPVGKWSNRNLSELVEIRQKRKLIPIIAHIDRYITPFRANYTFGLLEELPVLVQANASFYTGRTTRNLALKMLKQDKIHLLGSDCHNLTSRSPNLGNAVKIIEDSIGEEIISRINQLENELMLDVCSVSK